MSTNLIYDSTSSTIEFSLFNKYNALISVKMTTREEEYEAFKEFYYNIINELHIDGNPKEQAEK